MNWEIFSALSTFLAVLVALSITVFHHIYQLRIRLRVHLATQGRFSAEQKIIIVVTNLGLVPETITRILVKNADKHIVELHQDFELPKTLRAHEIEHFDSPYLAHNLDSVLAIYAEDSRGKRWNCTKESIQTIRRIYRNFIGKRFLYPSMGDKEYEDEKEENFRMSKQSDQNDSEYAGSKYKWYLEERRLLATPNN